MKNYLKFFLVLFVLFINKNIYSSIEPQNLIGSITGIKPYFLDEENRKLLISPLPGATLWEVGTIWNFYNFLSKEDPINKLTKGLFHENQRVGIAFRVSDKPRVKQLNSKSIGIIIGSLLKESNDLTKRKKAYIKNKIKTLVKIYDHDSDIDFIVNPLFAKNTNIYYPLKTKLLIIQALAYKKIETKKDLKSYFEGIADGLFFDIKKHNVFEIKKSSFFNKWSNKSNSQQSKIANCMISKKPIKILSEFILLKLETSTPGLFKALKEKAYNSFEAAVSVCDALKTDPTTDLSPEQKNGLLFLVDIDTFADEFKTRLNEELLKQLLTDEYINFLNSDEEIITPKIEEIETTLSSENGSSFLGEDFDSKKLEKFLIAKILFNYLEGFPKLALYKQVHYESKMFPDCTETAMRNLVSIIIFKNGAFDRNKLSGKFKEFYKSANHLQINKLDVHEEWIKYVSSLEFIPYYFIGVKGENSFNRKTAKDIPFVLVPNLDCLDGLSDVVISDIKVSIKNKNYNFKKVVITDENFTRTYIVVNKEKYRDTEFICCEMASCAESIVSLLLKIFNDDDVIPTGNDVNFFSPLFKKQLPSILGMLGLHIIEPDQVSYNKDFELKLKKEDSLSEFLLKIIFFQHGEIKITKQNKIEYNSDLIDKFNIRTSENNKKIEEFVSFADFTKIGVENINLANIYLLNLKSSLFRLNLISKFIFEEDEQNAKVLISSLKFEENPSYLKALILLIKPDSFHLVVDKAIEIAKEAVVSSETGIQELGFKILGLLVEKGEAVDVSTEAAFIALNSDKNKVQIAGFKILILLVKKGEKLDAIENGVKIVINRNNVNAIVKMFVGRILKLIVEKRQY